MATSDPSHRSASRTARFEEMRPTGRKVRGPLGDLIDLQHASGHHVAVRFANPGPIHEALSSALAPVRDFLEWPLVDGIAPLVAVRPGVLVYRTGRPVRTVQELVTVFADDGGLSVRATLQWLSRTARALIDIGIAGHDRGLVSHGSLDPWLLQVDDAGNPLVLGYGLPPFAIEAYLAGAPDLPPVERLRYAPPARLNGSPETVESDLCALCLVAAELASGRPVYRGSPAAVWAAAQRGDVRTSLEGIPAALSAILAPMLGAEGSLPDAERWWAQIDRASRQAAGPSLLDAVQQAADCVTDVEEELPSGFAVGDLMPADPERQAAEHRAQRALEVADETLRQLEAELERQQPELDRSLPRVARILSAMDVARTAAEEARRKVEHAVLRASSAPDGASANRAADDADAALADTRRHAEDVRENVRSAVDAIATSRLERTRERARETAARWARAEALAAEATWLPALAPRTNEVLAEARSAFRATQVVDGAPPPTDEVQLAAIEVLAGHLGTLEELADHGRAARQADDHVRAIGALQHAHPQHAEELGRHAAAAREAAERARTASSLGEAQAALERARQEATAAQAVGSFLDALQVDVRDAMSQIAALHAQVTEAYEAVPHPSLAALEQAVGAALSTLEDDPTAATEQVVVATEAAERAIELRQQLARRLNRARQQATDHLEQATTAAEAVAPGTVRDALRALQEHVRSAHLVRLPEEAEAAAEAAGAEAREILRQVGGLQAELQELRNRARQVLARLPDGVDAARLASLEAEIASLVSVREVEPLQKRVEGVRLAVDAWLGEIAEAQARMLESKEQGRKALARAESDHLSAPSDVVLHREGDDRPVDLGAMVEAIQTVVAQLENAVDPIGAQELADRATSMADEVATIVTAAREALTRRLESAKQQASDLAVTIVAEQSDVHAVDLQALYTRALQHANRAAQGDDLMVVQRDLDAARQVWEQANRRRENEQAHLASLQARGQVALESANELLEGASQPGVRRHVEAVHTAVEQVRVSVDPELVAQAVEAAEMSMQAARQVASEAISAARARARTAVEHARRVLERHDEGEVRLYAEAARAAGEIAANAETCDEVVQAAERAEVAAKAVEIARAQAAVEKAAVAVARSDGPDVRLAIEEARQAVSDAEDADSLAAAARAADAATLAAEAAHKAASRLVEVHDHLRARAQEALRATQRAATETQVAMVRELAQQGEVAMAQLESADSLDLAEVALQQIEALAQQAQQHASQVATHRQGEIVRATAAVSRVERARIAARGSERMERIATVADEQLARARATLDDAELLEIVNGIEQLAERADETLAAYLGAVADTAQRAIATLARAEALLDETTDDEVRQIVQRARTAARRAEEDETLPAMEHAEALADQALQAVEARVNAEAATARQSLQQQVESILVRMETAGEGFDDPRFLEHVQAIRGALGRIGAAIDAETARAEVAAANAAGEAAQAVVDSRLEVLRHQAREAAVRARQVAGDDAPSTVLDWVNTASEASEDVQRAINVAAAVASAEQAEDAAKRAVELSAKHRQALTEVRERAINARNRAEELIGRAPPAGSRAIEEARKAAEEALVAVDVVVAMAAAQRAETAANQAQAITDASRSVVEAHRARVVAAARRVEQSSYEASESVVKDSLAVVRNLSETVKASADPAVTEPAARAAEEAAERAEAAVADRRQRVAAMQQRAQDTRMRADGLLGLSSADEVVAAVETARAAAARAAEAEDLETAKNALVEAERAIAEGQRVAHTEVEQRNAARRRAQRALGGIQTLLEEMDTEGLQRARVTAREAVAQASGTSTVQVAQSAADAAEKALAEAEAEAQAYRAQLRAERQMAREANEEARAVLLRARGAGVEKAVDAARRAFDAAMAAASIEQAQSAAARAREAAQLASTLADQAEKACGEARERAHAAVEAARACADELASEQVQRKVDEAVAAAERADRAIAPEVARQAAEAAELAASGAREEIEIRHVRQEAAKAREQVASMLVPDLPQDAPPVLVQQHQALRQALVGVDHAVASVNGARGLDASRARAEVARRAAADVVDRFEALQEAIRVWQAQRRRQAATDVRPVEALLQKVKAQTAEVRRVAPKGAYGVYAEADQADQAAVEAVEMASRAAEAGDPDGVTAGLEGIRQALTRAQQAMKTAQMALQIEAQRKAAKVRQALRTALDEAEAMRQDAQTLLERVVVDDAKWHASRAAEAAAAVRDAAQQVMSEEPSDEGVERIEKGLSRAQAALETAFQEAPSGARTRQKSARPGERNRALEALAAVREAKPVPTPSFKAEPVRPESRAIPDYRRPVPDDPGPTLPANPPPNNAPVAEASDDAERPPAEAAGEE